MSAKQTLSKVFNVALVVASFGLVGAITAGVFSGGEKHTAESAVSDKAKIPTPAARP